MLKESGAGGCGLGGGGAGIVLAPEGCGAAGIWKVPRQRGHCINCPAYSSGTVSIFWQLGQRRFMGFGFCLMLDTRPCWEPRYPFATELANRKWKKLAEKIPEYPW